MGIFNEDQAGVPGRRVVQRVGRSLAEQRRRKRGHRGERRRYQRRRALHQQLSDNRQGPTAQTSDATLSPHRGGRRSVEGTGRLRQQQRVIGQDALMQRAKLRAGLQAKLGNHQLIAVPVQDQRIGAAA
jgi:hypothetical protein